MFRATKVIMSIAYGIILLAFVPLFVAFILLLQRNFDQMYQRMRIKLYISFFVFMLVMGFRYVVYNLIQFSNVGWYNVESVRGEIPLYVSEIFISFCYMKIMTSTYKQQKEKHDGEQPPSDQ